MASTLGKPLAGREKDSSRRLFCESVLREDRFVSNLGGLTRHVYPSLYILLILFLQERYENGRLVSWPYGMRLILPKPSAQEESCGSIEGLSIAARRIHGITRTVVITNGGRGDLPLCLCRLPRGNRLRDGHRNIREWATLMNLYGRKPNGGTFGVPLPSMRANAEDIMRTLL